MKKIMENCFRRVLFIVNLLKAQTDNLKKKVEE